MADDPNRDADLDEITRRVVHLVTRERPLTGNQLSDLAAHLQRLATHRIVEERLRQERHRSDAK